MTFKIVSQWPALLSHYDLGGSKHYVVNGNSRPFVLPTDATTSDVLCVRFHAFSNTASSTAKPVILFGKCEDDAAGDLAGGGEYTGFDTSRSVTGSVVVGSTTLTKNVLYEERFTLTADMVSHATTAVVAGSKGQTFELAIISDTTNNWIYSYGASLYLERGLH